MVTNYIKFICYRPIALTSCTCKTRERMIHLTGFRAKRSTIDHIVCIETLIREAFMKKEYLVAVLF